MEHSFFALATYSQGGSSAAGAHRSASFAALTIGEYAFEIAATHAAYRDSSWSGAGTLSATGSVLDLLEDWERNFAVLQAMADFVRTEGPASDRLAPAARLAPELRPLPPVLRPSKILNCAANYGGHVAEMRQYTQTGGNVDPARVYTGDKAVSQPYLFLKSPSTLAGAHDNIVMPAADTQLDWEAELAVVMGSRCRKVPADQALAHVAGFMTFNDVTARDQLFRADRPNFRTDWLSSKSHDSFGPCGPYLVPRAFVPHTATLRLLLKVNGEIKQDGLVGDMIYTPEEQIEYASARMTLEPGDIFATGTLAGVGQGSGVFLRPGDVVETEVQGLGRQRNRIVGPLA